MPKSHNSSALNPDDAGTRNLIIQELETASEPLLGEILDFVRFLKVKQAQEERELQEDLADLRSAREEAKTEGTVSWETLKSKLGLQ